MRLLSRGRTTLLIAHRLQTARAADRIVVLEDGQIAEQGSHDALVDRGGRYAELWQAFVQTSAPTTARAGLAGSEPEQRDVSEGSGESVEGGERA